MLDLLSAPFGVDVQSVLKVTISSSCQINDLQPVKSVSLYNSITFCSLRVLLHILSHHGHCHSIYHAERAIFALRDAARTLESSVQRPMAAFFAAI
jgi:hypothetical protein